MVAMFSVISAAYAAPSANAATPSNSSKEVITPFASKEVIKYYSYQKSITPPSTLNYSDAEGYQGTLNRIGITGTDGDNIIWMYKGTVRQN
ncbi:hypothetical protein [Brevibacillus agri]|uniref:hypothetical protein n=1 Tax=Brevibacillus agri TaxID=51101 RepID=UPI0018CF38DF|nr:hypothetical protein [Brevibacillus agri]